MPLVSIVIITYNRSNFIKKAIDSVLSQYFRDYELIVIDDCSSDNTEQVLRLYIEQGFISYYKNEENLGIVKSRNKALSLSRGKYIAVLDSDDIWLDKEKLSKQVDFLEQNSEYVCVGSMAKIINDNDEEVGEIVYNQEDKKIKDKMLLSNQFVHSSVLYRKEIAERLNFYSDYKVGEDYDLFLKMGLVAKLANLPDFFVSYRKHSEGATWSNRILSAREHLRIIRNYKKNPYPNFNLAIIKAYLRIFISYFKYFF